MKKAFTLIELLIVVAIIAILAAIAVPNFLEAQVRSKVARCKADMRSIGMAVESYTVDVNREPISVREAVYLNLPGNWDVRNSRWMMGLTTPIAYTTSIPLDPFRTMAIVNGNPTGWSSRKENTPYDYDSFTYIKKQNPASSSYMWGVLKNSHLWYFFSAGPSRQWGYDERLILAGYTDAQFNASVGGAGGGGWTLPVIYDPTNGTTSRGAIMRTNKGDINRPEPYAGN